MVDKRRHEQGARANARDWVVSAFPISLAARGSALTLGNGDRVLTFRPFQPRDSDAVIDLWNRCGLVRPTNDPKKDIARKQKVRGDLFLVGLHDERVVASVMIGYEGHRGWINYLAVCPLYRKRGYGRSIMAEAERLLRAEGCPKINLQVRTSNTEVLAFYRAIGFIQDDVVSLGKRLEDGVRTA